MAAAIARDPSTGAAQFACASDGTLAYVPATSLSEHAAAVLGSRDGADGIREAAARPVIRRRGFHPTAARRCMLGGTSLNGDVWVLEFANGTFRRFTFTSSNIAPIWSADGRTVYFTSFNPASFSVHVDEETGGWKPGGSPPSARSRHGPTSPGSTPKRRPRSSTRSSPAPIVATSSASRSGHRRLCKTLVRNAKERVFSGPESERPVARVSERRDWPARRSTCCDFGGTGARWQVTTEGGEEPHWSADGRQLFYRSSNRLMAVPLESGKTFRYGKPRPLFDGIYNSGIESGRSYDVDPKNKRFLLVRPADTGPPPRVGPHDAELAAGARRTIRGHGDHDTRSPHAAIGAAATKIRELAAPKHEVRRRA